MASRHSHRRHHHDRPDLAGEYKWGDAGQLIFALLFGGVWITDAFFLKVTTFLNAYVPSFIRVPIGIVLLVLAGYLAWKGLAIVFGEQRETPAVIRKNIFGIIRHPIYMSEILLYLGLFMFSLSLAAAGVLLLAMIFFHLISRYEERLLLERFGEEYEQYMQDVPMWIPRLWKKRRKAPSS
ncbi:MAG TPA: isoprenylcysteine carboxylmethyltransferase family protein [Anaerolineae bacterium]|nr:isoprenylcysteine carboxylmethyltransferase family protein [Anaerolineae bacterium]